MQDEPSAAAYSLDPYDLVLIAALLAMAIFTYPFAFECCGVAMMASRGLSAALARSRYTFGAGVLAVAAVVMNSDDALSFVLHRNVFASLSSESFIASRQASIIETFGMLLSFCLLLMLPDLAARYRTQPPKLVAGPIRTAICVAGAMFCMLMKWNHVMAPIAFLQFKSVSSLRINFTNPLPTAPLVALYLVTMTFIGGVFLMLAVQGIRRRWHAMRGTAGE